MCNNPSPLHGGKNCTGDATERKSCKEKDCPGKNYRTVISVLWAMTVFKIDY